MANNTWKPGDTCVMITNKAKGYTTEFTVENFDGTYYGIRRGAYYHRVSPNRIFPTREEAIASLNPQAAVIENSHTVPSHEETDEEINQGMKMGGM